MGTKKVKISATKRSHHINQKKNFRSKKPAVSSASKPASKKDTNNAGGGVKQKQKSTSVFGATKSPNKKAKKMKQMALAQPPPPKQLDSDESEVEAADVMDMIEEGELELMQKINLNGIDKIFPTTRNPRKRRNAPVKENDEDESEIEEDVKTFAEHNATRAEEQNLKPLLPIKTKTGEVVEQSISMNRLKAAAKHAKADVIEEDDEEEEEGEDEEAVDSDIAESDDEVKEPKEIILKAISTADLLIKREQELQRQKYRIGIICSGIIEKPEDKMNNFTALLQFMDARGSDGTLNMTTIRKIATVSVLELFKDIVPEYRIGFIDLKATKVKKDTMERVHFENDLLRVYKKYLQKLESFSSAASKKRKGQPQSISPDVVAMAELGVKCLCELLLAHPYFNFSQNIAQMLVFLSNDRSEKIRQMVEKTFVEIYKTDMRLEMALMIIRRTNQLIKSKANNVYVEVLTPLIHLPIKNVNLDAEKDKELKQKKLESHKSRIMNLSKKEKKRAKKLKEVDRELQEAQAEDNKQTKQLKLTEIAKMMFTIYFRILKNYPNSKLLGSALEGLAKFAHVINIEFFEDLVNVLNHLIENGDLGYREKLHCIQTIFYILSGQGEIFNIDPCRFYTHLYQNLQEVTAGNNHQDLSIIIKSLVTVLIKRRKHITQQRYLAFIKKIGTLSLQTQHHGSLALLALMKDAMQFNSSLDILLDPDNSIGSGRYDPHLDEPEYCNANCTALYEMCQLSRHYHPTVRKLSKHIVTGVPTNGEGSLPAEISKVSAHDFFTKYDSSEMAFNPPIPAPRNSEPKEKLGRHFYLDANIESFCNRKVNDYGKRCRNSEYNFCHDYSIGLKKNKI